MLMINSRRRNHALDMLNLPIQLRPFIQTRVIDAVPLIRKLGNPTRIILRNVWNITKKFPFATA